MYILGWSQLTCDFKVAFDSYLRSRDSMSAYMDRGVRRAVGKGVRTEEMAQTVNKQERLRLVLEKSLWLYLLENPKLDWMISP